MIRNRDRDEMRRTCGREKVLGAESCQQCSAARSTFTHWHAGPLQLCGCSLWEAVLERY